MRAFQIAALPTAVKDGFWAIPAGIGGDAGVFPMRSGWQLSGAPSATTRFSSLDVFSRDVGRIVAAPTLARGQASVYCCTVGHFSSSCCASAEALHGVHEELLSIASRYTVRTTWIFCFGFALPILGVVLFEREARPRRIGRGRRFRLFSRLGSRATGHRRIR
jgi:hypothetical protein